MKIKINKLTWTIINIIYFLTKDKNIFIKKITNLFFNPSTLIKLTSTVLKSFAALIWNHFIDYFTWFQKLRIDESIRITSFTKNPEGYWYGNNPELYNHIVDSNNIIINWETFHNRKIEGNSENLTYQHAEFKRRKRIYNKQLI
ncbi:hypothetical protein [Spiroplasma phoeniceum]|uniref:Uncharacterized protein n=1 Tax=Spiroplasma phoeniceum P40 TaxID=1276259 RepID=A0A345DMF3_9MOLU|nr:hypothetical protein [Spiroplasma phoeniceum]AXF95391.1 hypothetical protein SDAV_00397 [Spiroplasma phoeniceum P40]